MKYCNSSKLLFLIFIEPTQIDNKEFKNMRERWAKNVNREFRERKI